MSRARIHFLFLNIGHFLDHFFMLVFATAAALTLTREWNMSYAQLIPYATPGFIAFGAFALPAGWLADKWSRRGMMALFFIGIGAASALTALAQTPLQIAVGLFAIGAFAAIYHPVGISLVVQGREKTGVPLAVNGVFGNLGVASAALITGLMIDHAGWRGAFVAPGLVSIALGVLYLWLIRGHDLAPRETGTAAGAAPATYSRSLLARIFAIILVTTALGGIVFQSTTFALPKMIDERLAGLQLSASLVGWYAFMVVSLAALAQLVVGFLIDRYPARNVFVAVAALQAVFFALMPGQQDWAALLIAVAFMLAAFGQIPINDVLVGRIAASEWRSTVYASRYIVTFTALAAAIPLVAWVHANWGFDRLFMLLAVAALAILIAVLMLPRAIPARAQAPQPAE